MITTQKIHQFVIGGAVRDVLLGKHPKDIDYLWVGATPQHLLKLNMSPVGKDFPVFLDINGNEHALARIERKSGVGYCGFECKYDTSVTLEDDQIRRDLTINQLAVPIEAWEKFSRTADVSLVIDSFCGIKDLKNKVLRQTSDAFVEDPLRVLRTARFAARYEFAIHPDTLKTMRDIVTSGELDALPMERVFTEFKKAMMEDRYDIFFNVLNEVGAHDLYFNELTSWKNFGLTFANEIGATFEERVCLLFIGLKPSEAETLLTRIKAPKHLIDMAMWTCRIEGILDDMSFGIIEPFTNETLWGRLEAVKAWNNLDKMQAVARLFLFYNGIGFQDIQKVFTATRAGSKIGFNDLDPKTRDKLVGKEIGKAISQRRLKVIQELNLFPL